MRIGPLELLLVLAVVLLVFGAGRLPELGAALPRAARNFRRGLEEPDAPDASTTQAASLTASPPSRSSEPAAIGPAAPKRASFRPLGMVLAGVALLLLYLALSDASMAWPGEARLGLLVAGGVVLVAALGVFFLG